jgi:hypothetical protein
MLREEEHRLRALESSTEENNGTEDTASNSRMDKIAH